MCVEWLNSFNAFHAHMGPKPTPKHWLERIDNNGPYEPINCKWATIHEQMQNKSTTTPIAYRGKRMTLEAWGRELPIHVNTLRYRMKVKGLTLEQALTCPKNQRRKSLLP